MMKLDIADAKRRLLLPELARLLGVPGKVPERDAEAVPCFWPERHRHGDKRPSFNFHSGLTRYRCFGCGAAGDAGDLVAEWCGISQEEGLRRFLEMAGDESSAEATRGPVAQPHTATPPADPWNDSAEKEAKRRGWPVMRRGTREELAAVARLRGLTPDILLAASGMGWLRFCELAGRPAWVLLSSCGRMAQARRMDGGEWERGAHRFKAWSLPGSCAAVPIGLPSLSERVSFVGIASGGPDTLALLEFLYAEDRATDCAILGILGESVKLAAPVVKRFAGKRVRLFPHNDEAGRRSAATWAEQLTEAGATVDAFSFAAFQCKDLNDFLKLQPENRDCSVLPHE
jgi:hypothetical protein